MNIFIGGLPFQMTQADLEETFREYGSVETAKLILDKETGKSKGYGFVEMPNDEEAEKAIQELDGIEIYGRKIGVKKSDPKADNRSKPGGRFDNNRRPSSGGGYNRRPDNDDYKKRY
ncbi:RNA-binding protein [Pedobacter sp. HMF7647]|uniref:RNA-binding protein n=1 Tax=Hufsiella arboris TaxID=2695275 RepID=A0A7K1Y6X6_9SPHI|nr:RNA-binding protein [Hufsiella arboris]MXV50190.1 RNA-binding protein [Hufsiella arboris]